MLFLACPPTFAQTFAAMWGRRWASILLAASLISLQSTAGHDEFGAAKPPPGEGFDYEWRQGRSTWYGGQTQDWSIHQVRKL
ncbi:hypothetical protein DUNSADRAFT_14611 [Dunaliella salina]|uniref:Uncharacterized protein n=1 Tax=Dunaliella salina TaxID=3046 RepID=A0ABQ7H2G0_DUNSA|nr:hypothetical protein DUNSADRAFT_14611 [Dunaliella salina]|eukprot:KAF5841053.1 hypothetical protein DUNSADRAFT_14611 [Dunaliella salina]